MRSIEKLTDMAIHGLTLAEEDVLQWYDIARDEHERLWRAMGGDSYGLRDLYAISALASYNASPARQCQIVEEWIVGGCDPELPGFLPNAREGLDAWNRHGKLLTAKAEAYRIAMMEGSQSDSVVLDRHMLRACGLKYSSKPLGADPAYNLAASRVRKAGRSLGISGAQCQAAIWYSQVWSTSGRVYGDEGLIRLSLPVC